MEFDESMLSAKDLRNFLVSLTGQELPISNNIAILEKVARSISIGQSLGYSQFNELLLTVGYDRVHRDFFLYLCDPLAMNVHGEGADEIVSKVGFKYGIDAFRELSLLLYGNVKFGFKELSRNSEALKRSIDMVRRERSDCDLRSRHDPLVPLKKINGDEAHLLGYVSGTEIDQKLAKDPENSELLSQKKQRDEVIEKGKWNHDVYLAFDHLDVYVATSMREKHEYLFVSDFMARMESNPHIRDLKIRFFDPTAAYCIDRLDKGLAEALMLKRAACTVYLAQESDTLGKDSELASTLAQGKPVIAFVPKMSGKLYDYLLHTFKIIYPANTMKDTLIRLLRIYKPSAAWDDKDVRDHLSGKKKLTNEELTEKVRVAIENHYEKRAGILKDVHPLGLQTNLNTGVANGILVARSVDVCAHLIRRILLNKMEYGIFENNGSVLLKEKLTDCTYRMMTADKLLTNSFWNFYNMT
ncbi:hypothetical protein AAKU55_005586 [Oxalobacteraceae bacterium GrIS 1.11]